MIQVIIEGQTHNLLNTKEADSYLRERGRDDLATLRYNWDFKDSGGEEFWKTSTLDSLISLYSYGEFFKEALAGYAYTSASDVNIILNWFGLEADDDINNCIADDAMYYDEALYRSDDLMEYINGLAGKKIYQIDDDYEIEDDEPQRPGIDVVKIPVGEPLPLSDFSREGILEWVAAMRLEYEKRDEYLSRVALMYHIRKHIIRDDPDQAREVCDIIRAEVHDEYP